MGWGKQVSHSNLLPSAPVRLSYRAPGTAVGLPIQPPRPSPPKTPLLSAFAVLVEAGALSSPQQHGAGGKKIEILKQSSPRAAGGSLPVAFW